MKQIPPQDGPWEYAHFHITEHQCPFESQVD